MIIVFIGLVVCATAKTHFDLALEDTVLFEQFVTHYNKNYATEEEKTKRFDIFQKNVKNIRELNAARQHEWEASYGINSRIDMTEEELQLQSNSNMRMSMSDRKLKQGLGFPYNNDLFYTPPLPTINNLPKNHFYCSELVSKNTARPKVDLCGQQMYQGQCGCCYAAAAANLGQIHYANMSYYYNGQNASFVERPLFTPQRWIDNTNVSISQRCCGGISAEVLHHQPTYSLESDYPFVDEKSTNVCKRRGDQNKNVKIKMRMDHYHFFAVNLDTDTHAQRVEAIKKILYHYGPFLAAVSVGADAQSFNYYQDGIHKFPASCTGEETDHQITIVGYGEDNGQEYFLLRNTWYDDWGIDGNYMKVSTDVLCGIGFGEWGVIPGNVLVFDGACSLDENCLNCDTISQKCNECKAGYGFDARGMCVETKDKNQLNGASGNHFQMILMMIVMMIFMF